MSLICFMYYVYICSFRVKNYGGILFQEIAYMVKSFHGMLMVFVALPYLRIVLDKYSITILFFCFVIVTDNSIIFRRR